MTRYILLGGSAKRFVNSSNRFRQAFSNIKDQPIKILIISFAKYDEAWPKDFKKFQRRLSFLKNPKTKFFQAPLDKKELTKLFKTCKLIIFTGGSELTFLKNMSKIKFDLTEKHLFNKTVLGTSAGTNILSKYYFSNDRNELGRGLGFVNLKTICHYSDEKFNLLKKLYLYKMDECIPVVAIREGEFIEIYQ